MKTRQIILILSAALGLVGCASNRGGTGEELNTSYGEERSAPVPRSSPTMRPGMNPQDIRDPNGLTFPEAPPTTPPKPAPEEQP